MKKASLLISSLIFCASILSAQTIDFLELEGKPSRLFLNGSDLYITQGSTFNISKVDLSNSPPVVEDVYTGLLNPASMAVHGNDLYVAVYGQNKISKVNLSISNPTLEDVLIEIDRPNGLAFIGDDLYISQSQTNQIVKFDITDSLPNIDTVATGFDFPTELAVIGDYLYVSEIGGDKVSKINITSALPISLPTTVVTGINNPIGLFSNGTDLFVARNSDGIVSKIDVSGSMPIISNVVSGLKAPIDIVIFEDDLYIAEIHTKKILKVENYSVGIESYTMDDLSIFPNPFTDYIYISPLKGRVEYGVSNVDGVRLKTGTLNENEGINLSDLDKGVYILQTEGGVIRKIVKE